MNVKRKTHMLSLLLSLALAPWCVYSEERLLVNMTLVRNATAYDAVCLDGSLPAYHLHRGFGAGANNWILQFEGGGWCNNIASCLERAKTRRGSTRYMSKLEVFSGILSNNASLNPDFYNWNRVKLRYCDGASFSGDSKFDNGDSGITMALKVTICKEGSYTFKGLLAYKTILGKTFELALQLIPVHMYASENEQTSLLYFRGQKVWEAIIYDLLPKGLASARKALLSGCSAGGLATFLHCDNFTKMVPSNASVKCLSDAGFFLDERDISLNYTMRSFYHDLVALQGIEQNLNPNCTRSINNSELCFFPQYALKYITTPYFILNSAYDVFQFHHSLVPPSADLHGHWNRCKLDPEACDANQINVLQGLRHDLLVALCSFYKNSRRGGMFINSCFAHCQSESQDTWFAVDSPRIHNKTIAEAVGDWYFGRNITKEIDCPYPCDTTCHNLIPSPQVSLR